MRRNYRFLLRPTAKQTDSMTAMLNDHRDLYNAALQERRDAWRQARVPIRHGGQSAQLRDIRRDDPDGQGRWSFSSQQATLRRLQRAFQRFFDRVRLGQTPGHPRFKPAQRFNYVEWSADGDGCRWESTAGAGRVYLRGVGHVRVHKHRAVRGRVKTVAIRRDGRRWYVILSCDQVPTEPLPATGRAIGIDLGVVSFLTTSDGEQIPNPRYGRAAAKQLAEKQRAFARCKRGSKRRSVAKLRVKALHGRLRRQRLDHAHKVARLLTTHHDVICHEKLILRSMTRSARGTVEKPGTHVQMKANLNRSIFDAGWGVFLRVLAAKAESAGRELIAVDPRHTSRTCPSCEHQCAENRVSQAEFRCTKCGYSSHADVVGAINVLRAGLARREALIA